MFALFYSVLFVAPTLSVPVVTQPPAPQSQPGVRIYIRDSDVGELWRQLRDADRQIDYLEDQMRWLSDQALKAQVDYRSAATRAQQAADDARTAEGQARAADSHLQRLERQLYRGFESSPEAQTLKRTANELQRRALDLRRQLSSPLAPTPGGRELQDATFALRRTLHELGTQKPTLALVQEAWRQWLRQQRQLWSLLVQRLDLQSQLAWYSLMHQQVLAQLGQARQGHNESLDERREWQRAQQELDQALTRLPDAQGLYERRALEAEAARQAYQRARQAMAITEDRLQNAREQREHIARDLRHARDELHMYAN